MTGMSLIRPVAVLAIVVACFACSKEPARVEAHRPDPIPFGWLDLPDAGTVTGKTVVKAWALTNVGTITKTEILFDGTPLQVTLHGVASAWACELHPQCEGCEKARYEGEFDFASVAKGEHMLSWRVTTSAGAIAEIGKRKIVVE